MVTEAFIIKHNENEVAYLDIDRTYKYGGIMLLSDLFDGVCMGGIEGCSCFQEFSLENLLNVLNLSSVTFTFEVHKDCDGGINNNIKKTMIDDILSIAIEDKIVKEIKNSNNEIIYCQNEDYIGNYEVGWLGKIFDYYTNILSNDIECFDENYNDYIWGVYY